MPACFSLGPLRGCGAPSSLLDVETGPEDITGELALALGRTGMPACFSLGPLRGCEAPSSLLDIETLLEDITGELATEANVYVVTPAVRTGFKSDPFRCASNACSDSVATLATATSAPGSFLSPNSNSLYKYPE